MSDGYASLPVVCGVVLSMYRLRPAQICASCRRPRQAMSGPMSLTSPWAAVAKTTASSFLPDRVQRSGRRGSLPWTCASSNRGELAWCSRLPPSPCPQAVLATQRWPTSVSRWQPARALTSRREPSAGCTSARCVRPRRSRHVLDRPSDNRRPLYLDHACFSILVHCAPYRCSLRPPLGWKAGRPLCGRVGAISSVTS